MIVGDDRQKFKGLDQFPDPNVYPGKLFAIVIIIIGLVPAGLAEPFGFVPAVPVENSVLVDL
jgi:hypothetical protein